jgi:hypothetical protein
MARWVAFQLGAYRDRERTGGVLSAATLREMHRPRYLADDEWTQAWGSRPNDRGRQMLPWYHNLVER